MHKEKKQNKTKRNCQGQNRKSGNRLAMAFGSYQVRGVLGSMEPRIAGSAGELGT